VSDAQLLLLEILVSAKSRILNPPIDIMPLAIFDARASSYRNLLFGFNREEHITVAFSR
jgi:hypothetical protein